MLKKRFQISNSVITQKSKTFIISEIGINHEGNFEKCLKMISLSKKAGADAVKLQTINPDLSYAKNTHSYKEFLKTNFTDEELLKLINFAKKIGLIFISTPGSFEEVDKLKKFKCNAIKISSGQMTNYPLISYASKKKTPLIISTGMAYLSEIVKAIKACDKNSNIALLKCTSLYPTKDELTNISSLNSLNKTFKNIVGYSDHTKDELSCIAAVAAGAKIIEKHFTLNSKKRGKDHHISLEPKKFQLMIHKIRRVEKMLGDEKIFPVKQEISRRKFFHRYIVAKKNINKGDKFNYDNLAIKRIKKGALKDLKPQNFNKICRMKSKRKIRKDKTLNINDLK